MISYFEKAHLLWGVGGLGGRVSARYLQDLHVISIILDFILKIKGRLDKAGSGINVAFFHLYFG